MAYSIDRLIIWVNGSEIEAMDSFTNHIGILSQPAAVPERRHFTISIICVCSTDWKNKEFTKSPFRKERKAEDEAGILLAKFGLMLVK